MVGLNKHIMRTVLILSYIMVVALIIAGISAIFSYLNTGADRSNMLHTEIKQTTNYTPQLNWNPLNNLGRPIDQENLKSIEKDYLDAWFVQHLAFKTNKTTGIEDYYTKNARLNIYDFIAYNTKHNIYIDATTLNHNPTLEFFSEDGQLAVITDNNVIEYKHVYKSNTLITKTKEVTSYKFIMLLEDGFWRIRHKQKVNSEAFKNSSVTINTDSLNIKGINYYPQNSAWDMYGELFSKDTIAKDFKLIKSTGLNAVRIFVPYEDFGKEHVNPEKLKKLKETLDQAEQQQLKVIVTLFDFYGDYSIINWSLNQKHALSIVNKIKNHKALLAWDIKNEPNLDFESRGKQNVTAWLTNMIDIVKSADNNHPVTIGWSNTNSALLLEDKVDFVSFHYYENLSELDTKINLLKKGTEKPIVLQEFGMSSYSGFWNPFGNNEKDQANYHKKAQDIIAKNNLQYMSWTLYDFKKIPKEVVGKLPWRKNAQKHFGFINKNGAKKLSFNHITSQ